MEFYADSNYLDQHFLIDKKIINILIDNAKLNPNDIVVEVGPGKCVISEVLAKRTEKLILIEKDNRLESFINVLLDKYDNTEIIWGNVLNTYIPKCNKIISALPYSITEPFIEKLLRCDFEDCLLIVGSNYANNVISNNTNKLSLLTNSFFKVEKIADIYPESFEPRPKVMSSLIKINKVKRKELNMQMFIFREMFYNRSRKLKNNLIESFIEYKKINNEKLTKKESKAIVDKLNIDKSILNKEMEQLANHEYALIFEVLNTIQIS